MRLEGESIHSANSNKSLLTPCFARPWDKCLAQAPIYSLEKDKTCTSWIVGKNIKNHLIIHSTKVYCAHRCTRLGDIAIKYVESLSSWGEKKK